MKILVSWSSGKDSAWMLHVIRAEGLGEPAALLTTINETANRVAMHAVRTDVLQAQADAAGLPLVIVPIPHPCSNEVYEARMSAAIAAAKAEGFTHVAFGDLFLEDIRRYREERMEGTGLTPIFPLWLRPTPTLAARDAQGRAGGLPDLRRSACPACVIRGTQIRRLTADRFAAREWTPAASAVSFTPARLPGRCSRGRIDVAPGMVVERDGFVFADLVLRDPGSVDSRIRGPGIRGLRIHDQ